MEIKRVGFTEAGLVINLFNSYRIFYQQPPNIALAKEFIYERLQNNESVIFVAVDDNNQPHLPVGFTQLYPKYSSVSTVKNWILNDLFVESNSRKQGIGEKLIKAAMDFAKSEGATYVQLETALDNYTAQSLYENMGFLKQDPETTYLLYRIQLS